VTIHAYKIGEEDGRVVIHRNFDGDHEDSETCWCRPEVIDGDSLEDANEIAERLERPDA
jgi:hypothetical protein